MDLCKIKEIKTSREIYAVHIGRPFGVDKNVIIAGSTKGRIDLIDYHTNDILQVIETKSGDVLQILTHDLTKFNMEDLIVGDKDGQLTIFSNRLILSTYQSHSPITSMTVDIGHHGSQSIVFGTQSGCIIGYQPGTDHSYKVNLGFKPISNYNNDNTIESIESIIVNDVTQTPSHYVIVSNGSKRLFFYNNKDLVFIKDFPHSISSLLKGNFTNCYNDPLQIAVGTFEGVVYILDGLDVKETIMLDGKITKLKKCKYNNYDLLLCCGEFNGIKICSKDSCIYEIEKDYWVDVISIGDIDNDGKEEIIFGSSQNQFLEVYKLESNV